MCLWRNDHDGACVAYFAWLRCSAGVRARVLVTNAPLFLWETVQAGILWKTLNCKSTRRAPLISACIFLHNWRIDRSLSRNFKEFYDHVRDSPGGGIEVMVSPGEFDAQGNVLRAELWVTPPQVDRDGRLVELLSTDPDWNPDPIDPTLTSGLFPQPSQRERLERAIALAGIQRPRDSASRRRDRQRTLPDAEDD